MNFEDKCSLLDCNNDATKLTSKPEGGIIEVCTDCWNKIYRS